MKKIGVKSYNFYTFDGHSQYYGEDSYSLATDPKFDKVNIPDESSSEALSKAIKIHQKGETDFPTFLKQTQEAGVNYWASDLEKMIVSYFNKKDEVLISESIPEYKQ